MTRLSRATVPNLSSSIALDTWGPEDLDAEPEVDRVESEWERVLTVGDLATDFLADPMHRSSPLLLASAASIPKLPTPDLLSRLATANNPFRAWTLNVELTQRRIPPCLRPPLPDHTAQARYVAVASDLQWLHATGTQLRMRDRRAMGIQFYGAHVEDWRGLEGPSFTLCEWSGELLKLVARKHGRNYDMAAALGLTDDQRRQLATLPSQRQSIMRRELDARLESIQSDLLEFAQQHPDKAASLTPEAIASRQVACFDAYARSGGHGSDARHFLKEAKGLDLTRQAMHKTLDKVYRAPGARRVIPRASRKSTASQSR